MFFLNQKVLTPKLADLVAKLELDQPADVQLLTRIFWQAVTEGQFTKAGKVIQEPLPPMVVHNPVVEARLNILTRTYKQVKVIPEVFTEQSMKEELDGFVYFQDPKVLEATKRTNAQIAIEWLRKMAVGELEGYPFIDAEAALRKSAALEGSGPASDRSGCPAREQGGQQDLASVVLLVGEDNPPANRLAAADALIKHIQLRGTG